MPRSHRAERRIDPVDVGKAFGNQAGLPQQLTANGASLFR